MHDSLAKIRSHFDSTRMSKKGIYDHRKCGLIMEELCKISYQSQFGKSLRAEMFGPIF
jgi:hypothetical protein